MTVQLGPESHDIGYVMCIQIRVYRVTFQLGPGTRGYGLDESYASP